MTDLFGSRFDVGCTVDIENSFENLHAYVDLDGDPEIVPGDRVKVHGEPVTVSYGEKLVLRRMATVHKATALERAWSRFTGNLDFIEMFEVSFTPKRAL
ncbi:MAG: hypothetical protein QNJ84_00870 [Alphaproteobacteria bacterium]|nr:hypothetical protein [Alphaproteobacteria bacterium]